MMAILAQMSYNQGTNKQTSIGVTSTYTRSNRRKSVLSMATADSTSNLPLKRCSKCGEYKPPTAEYFQKDKQKIDGLCSACKECRHADARIACATDAHRAYQRNYDNSQRRKMGIEPRFVRTIEDGKARCSKCREWKDVNQFTPSSKSLIGLANWCRECHRSEEKKKNHARGVKPARIGRVENGKRECLNCLNWFPDTSEFFYKSSRGGSRPICKKCFSENVNIYIKKNLGIVSVWAERRRTRKRSLPYNFTIDDWNRCLDYWHGLCAVCDNQLNDLFGTRKAHADHWIPISNPECPGTIPENIICLCSKCNTSKGAKKAEDWLIKKLGQRKARIKLQAINQYFERVHS